MKEDNIKEDIEPIDSNGQWHGYQEWYYDGFDRGTIGEICYRCNFKHGKEIGYEEWHSNYENNFHIR